MNKRIAVFLVRLLVAAAIAFNVTPVAAANLTIQNAGRVSVELVTSDALFRNTLSVISPTVGIAAGGDGRPASGCQLEPAVGLGGLRILSEKASQHGCRVDLDANPATAAIDAFAANTTFEFALCAQTDADPDCEFVWSSNPSNNSDNFDHVQTTTLAPGVFQLAWEDLENGGDMDFNDMIVVVRVQADRDGDGLWDDWEELGIDTDGNGTRDFNLPALGADPDHKDIFLEIDFMDCATPGGDCAMGDNHTHQPDMNTVINPIIQAFANAPVTNPDGNPGITLHVDIGNVIPHQNFLNIPGLCFAGGAGIGNFDTVKADPANFGPNNPRRFVYHYALFTHLQTNDTSNPNQTSSGCAELPGNDFQVSMGGFTGGIGTAQQQAGTLMHEFGHTLQLCHGGVIDPPQFTQCNTNRKPNYVSIMNYAFQTRGIPPTDPDGAGPLTARVDFSRADLADLNENNLNEPAGIGDGTDNTRYFCPNSTERIGTGTGAIDWNCDNDGGTDASVSVSVNGDGTIGTLTGFDDWNNLRYTFQNSGGFADGVHETEVEIIELDYPTHLQIPETVVIDIKPDDDDDQDDPNTINCKAKNKVIPVAILTTDNFDALSVDHTTVSFEGASETHLDQNGDPRRHERDVDEDGDIDLVFHFRLGDTSLTCDSTTGTLTGTTFDGSAIIGIDDVRMIKDD
ncbi:MAG TPA: DUF4114 domain-containing protein [Anaerolineales bacterium]|nr:DUF4114 domain-containing protein [Anaerolineales bacterium]